MKKHWYKTTTGKRGLHTEEEIKMILEFESRGFTVDEIKTVDGKTIVKWGDGTKSVYYKIVGIN